MACNSGVSGSNPTTGTWAADLDAVHRQVHALVYPQQLHHLRQGVPAGLDAGGGRVALLPI